ncbi:MAG: family 43 glycosylhydrolase [Agathobacter sp.]
MLVKNPIVRGFYPDPSVCEANGKYYMVCSSFEYFPGVPLFESEDLVNWKQIGHCLTRKSQVELSGVRSSGGVFAPTIRYHEGVFYMVTNNNSYNKNFYIKTEDIYGEWSDPFIVDQEGIDPSLLFEEGKVYFTSNGNDAEGRGCILQCEIDINTGEKLTESRPIWHGSGGRYLESPHLYHFGDWYYIMVAEGGTEYGHMVTYAKGKTPYGPFESYPGNPVLTNRNLGGHQSLIQGIGHGDLIQDKQGRTFMVTLGFRQQGMWMPFHQLGREVYLSPVFWQEDGWFTAGVNGTVAEEMEMDIDAAPQKEGIYDVSFETLGETSVRWCHLREYEPENYNFTKKGADLCGNAHTLEETECPTFLGIRQSEFDTELSVDVESEGDEAGVTFYLCEDHHYDLAVRNITTEKGTVKSVVLHLCCGDVKMDVKEVEIPKSQKEVCLQITSTPEEYFFYATIAGEKVYMGKARSKYLTSEVAGGFTGVVMGMYAINHRNERKWAQFANLNWVQKNAK